MADASRFGVLLRRHRTARSLTQERLAEVAGISTNAVAALESGRRRTPRLSTVQLLVTALDLDADDRDELIAAATNESTPAVDLPLDVRSTPNTAHDPVAREFPGVLRRFAFVGRPAELARLRTAWTEHTRVVLVAGEAGAGKTRLIGEFAHEVAGRGDGALGPLLPRPARRLRAVRRARARGTAPRDPAGSAHRRAAAHRSRTRQRRPIGAGPETAASRRRTPKLLFDAVVELVAGAGRCLLVVDDVQWADEGSLALLAHLAAAAALTDLTIVGTIRSTDIDAVHRGPHSEISGAAQPTRGSTWRGWATTPCTPWSAPVAGPGVAPELVAAVAAATEGNPLFVAELTEHLLTQQWQPPDPTTPARYRCPCPCRPASARP